MARGGDGALGRRPPPRVEEGVRAGGGSRARVADASALRVDEEEVVVVVVGRPRRPRRRPRRVGTARRLRRRRRPCARTVAPSRIPAPRGTESAAYGASGLRLFRRRFPRLRFPRRLRLRFLTTGWRRSPRRLWRRGSRGARRRARGRRGRYLAASASVVPWGFPAETAPAAGRGRARGNGATGGLGTAISRSLPATVRVGVFSAAAARVRRPGRPRAAARRCRRAPP